jgi:hypothetical protein
MFPSSGALDFNFHLPLAAGTVLLFQPRLQNRFADGHFMKQKFRRLHLGVRMKPALHHVIVKQIENRQQRHALVVRHPLAHQDRLVGSGMSSRRPHRNQRRQPIPLKPCGEDCAGRPRNRPRAQGTKSKAKRRARHWLQSRAQSRHAVSLVVIMAEVIFAGCARFRDAPGNVE